MIDFTALVDFLSNFSAESTGKHRGYNYFENANASTVSLFFFFLPGSTF